MCDLSEFQCGNDNCIPESYICDGDNDCLDNTDERGCSNMVDEFTCDNGNWIIPSYRCDGDNDCGDNSDEIGCAGCGDNEFKCHDGACIPASYACDSWADCSQGEDDCGCGECGLSEFQCGNDNCIPESYICVMSGSKLTIISRPRLITYIRYQGRFMQIILNSASHACYFGYFQCRLDFFTNIDEWGIGVSSWITKNTFYYSQFMGSKFY